MDERKPPTGIESRREERLPLEATVTIDFAAGSIVGPGQNISREGVYFTAEGSLPVTVRIGDSGRQVRGQVVRFESMGDGRIGVAIRFLEPCPAPVA